MSHIKEHDRDHETKKEYEESEFRWLVNDNAMASEKLAEGIRNFYADQLKLESLISEFQT